jgi:hypothetical protein
MHRDFVLLFSALAIALAWSATSWATDRIVLKDGNVVEGEIIRTTERDITVKGRFGMITFPLKQVRRVREDGKFWTPPETPAEEEAPTEAELALGFGQSDLKQRLLRSIQEIEANPLGQWTNHAKEPAPNQVEHRYRLLKDGVQSFSDRLPASGGDYEQVWVHQREAIEIESGGLGADGGSLAAESGRSACYWVPLYWHEMTGRWLPNHPLQSSFRWEEDQVAKMLERIADHSGRGNASRIEAVVDKLESSPEQHDELKRKLRQLTTVVAGEWGGDELLYRVYLKNLAIVHASDSEKVELAKSRRDELRQLISAVP